MHQGVQIQAFPAEQQLTIARAQNSPVGAGRRENVQQVKEEDFADLVKKMLAEEEAPAPKDEEKAKSEATEEQNPLHLMGMAMVFYTDLSVEQNAENTDNSGEGDLTVTGETGLPGESIQELTLATEIGAEKQGELSTSVDAGEELAADETGDSQDTASFDSTQIEMRLEEDRYTVAESEAFAGHVANAGEETPEAGEQVKTETEKPSQMFEVKLTEETSITGTAQKQEASTKEQTGDLAKGNTSKEEEVSRDTAKVGGEEKREFSVKLTAEDSMFDYHPAVESSGNTDLGNAHISEVATSEASAHSSMTQRIEDQEKVVKQVLSQAKVMVEKGIAKVEMNLEPQELGKLELSLVIERDVVAASFVAESKAVQSIIEANLSDLRTALQDAGLKADMLEVGVQTGAFGHREETASAFKQSSSHFYPDYLAEETDEFQMAEAQAWGRVDFRA